MRIVLILAILVPVIAGGYFFYRHQMIKYASVEVETIQNNLKELREQSARFQSDASKNESQRPVKDFFISIGYEDAVSGQIAEKSDYVGLFNSFNALPDFTISVVTKDMFTQEGLDGNDILNKLIWKGLVQFWEPQNEFRLNVSKDFDLIKADLEQLFPDNYLKIFEILKQRRDIGVYEQFDSNKNNFSHFVFQDIDGKKISKEIYSLLTGSADSEILDRINSQEISSLTDKQKIETTGAFLCSYQSFLAYVAIKMRGWKVFPIFMQYADLPDDLTRASSQDSSWWRFLFKKDDPYAKWDHVSLLVYIGHDKFLFFDSANTYVSKLFTLKEYSVLNKNYFTLVDPTRKDLYASFKIVDIKSLQSYFFTSYSRIIEAFGGNQAEADRALTKAKQFNPNFPEMMPGYLDIE